jgi:hypothetical protein
MINIWGGHITRTSDEIQKYNYEELVTKIYNSVYSYRHLETRINEFNNYFQDTTFKDKLAFQLEIAIMKHHNPVERIKWETSFRIPWLMNEIDNEPYSSNIYCILDDYINEESIKSMKQILTVKDVMTGDGKILKDMRVFDCSKVDSPSQYDNYKSIIFEVTNHDLIKHYYRDYLYYFPLTLAEFEKVFFFFLTFLAEQQYPLSTEMSEICTYKREINDILQIRYIDIHDKVILALIHIICTDPELHNTCESIFNELNDIEDLNRIQFDSMAS